MKQMGLNYFDDLYLTLIALGIFFIFFLWQVVVLYFKKNGSEYSHIERLVFDDSFHPATHATAHRQPMESSQTFNETTTRTNQ